MYYSILFSESKLLLYIMQLIILEIFNFEKIDLDAFKNDHIDNKLTCRYVIQ